MSGSPVSQQVSFSWLFKLRGSARLSVTNHQPSLCDGICNFFSGRWVKPRLKSVPFTSNSPSHSYLQATSAELRSLIKVECCPDLSPFPLKCSVLCSMRKSFAAWFNEPSVEPADLMTCENINLLPPRVLLLGKQSIIHPRFFPNLTSQGRFSSPENCSRVVTLPQILHSHMKPVFCVVWL